MSLGYEYKYYYHAMFIGLILAAVGLFKGTHEIRMLVSGVEVEGRVLNTVEMQKRTYRGRREKILVLKVSYPDQSGNEKEVDIEAPLLFARSPDGKVALHFLPEREGTTLRLKQTDWPYPALAGAGLLLAFVCGVTLLSAKRD